MEKITLSYLHKLIKRKEKEVLELKDDIRNLISKDFTIIITPSTTESIFENFKNSNIENNEKIKDYIDKLCKIISEVKRLKIILNKENALCGINELMIESSHLMKKIHMLEELHSYSLSYKMNDEFYTTDPMTELADIKSSFTDNNKRFEKSKYSITDKEVNEIKSYIDYLKLEKEKKDDEIAILNQKTLIEI